MSASLKAADLALKLTMSTVEVEGIEEQAKDLENIVVGKILKIQSHPNADKLKICQVDAGKEKLSVVCGGSNLREGMLVALGKVGAKVRWHGEGELMELKPASIRGVESHGMICAANEIGLEKMFPLKSEKEILDLSFLLTPPSPQRGEGVIGQPIAKALHLDDAILEIDNKSLSNRPDLWGHYGIAREVSALYGGKLALIKSPSIKPGKEMKIDIEVKDKKLCPRYMAVVVDGVKVEESPAWLKKKLLAVGVRPINNIVDITNYVMLDLGQPMHAFDAEKLFPERSTAESKGGPSTSSGNKKIVVRTAKEGEKFRTLDDVDYDLDSSILVIADEEKPVALAGIMGGENSGISDDTKTIVFEAANFDAACVRKTSVKLGIRTDSSARFEKSLDPNLCQTALRRAIELALQFCSTARVASPVADVASFHLYQGPINLPLEFLDKKIGLKIKPNEVIRILTKLGFKVQKRKDILAVTVPTWRATKDISIPEDLVEEVARIYGYDNVKPCLPVFPVKPPVANELRKLEHKVRETMVQSLGYSEVYNYSFISPEQIQKIGDKPSSYLELDNPLSKERPYLRRHIVNNLLENTVRNIEFFPEVKIFEIGKTFLAEAQGEAASEKKGEFLPRQDSWFTGIYANKKDQTPYWQARRAAEALAMSLHMSVHASLPMSLHPWQHPGRSAVLAADGQEVGAVYEINARTSKTLGLEARAGVIEINLSALLKYLDKEKQKKYESLSVFPEVTRDLAIIVKKEITHADLKREILKTDPLLKKVELFDFYEGDKIEKGYKSLAYHVVYTCRERTLTAGEVDAIQDKIVSVLTKKFKARLRA